MVEYFSVENAPGQYFRCQPYGSTMRVESCASMYRAEKACKGNGRHPHCHGCEVGALHAGEKVESSSPVYGSKFCPRCARTASRIVKGVCVSCLNREYEVVKGRNAKGAPPVHLPKLAPCVLAWTDSENQVHISKFERVANRVEGVYRVLRTTPGQVLFGWACKKPALPQLSLFDPISR